jgi:hypothetical protein
VQVEVDLKVTCDKSEGISLTIVRRETVFTYNFIIHILPVVTMNSGSGDR